MPVLIGLEKTAVWLVSAGVTVFETFIVWLFGGPPTAFGWMIVVLVLFILTLVAVGTCRSVLAGTPLAFWERWHASPGISHGFQPSTSQSSAVDDPIVWDDHFGIEYSAQRSGQVYMRTFIVNGTNQSNREVTIEDLYFVSGTTGKRLQLVVVAGPNDGFLHPKDINPVPPGATLTARAEFNSPTGLLPNELMDAWGEVLFYSVYEGKDHLKRFDRKTVEATFAGFRPKSLGPRVTKRET